MTDQNTVPKSDNHGIQALACHLEITNIAYNITISEYATMTHTIHIQTTLQFSKIYQ